MYGFANLTCLTAKLWCQSRIKKPRSPEEISRSTISLIALSFYFRTNGTSVQLPCATSAAMLMLSPSVGWAWMVLPMPTVSALLTASIGVKANR